MSSNASENSVDNHEESGESKFSRVAKWRSSIRSGNEFQDNYSINGRCLCLQIFRNKEVEEDHSKALETIEN